VCVSFVNAAIRGSDAFHGYLPDDGLDVVGFMSRLEARLIESALERAGTTAGAARLLGLNRTTLVERLKRAQTAQKANENELLHEPVEGG
jgi:DNA-binding NtrC family response regulator